MSDRIPGDFMYEQDSPEWRARHAVATTGAEVEAAQHLRVAQLIRALGPPSDDEEAAKTLHAAVSSMTAIGPRNEVEGMLASQMIATHHAAMTCMLRAVNAEMFPDFRELEMRHATRLMQLYTRQIDTLEKLRNSDKFANYQNLPRPKSPAKKPASPPGSPVAAKDPDSAPGRACDDPA